MATTVYQSGNGNNGGKSTPLSGSQMSGTKPMHPGKKTMYPGMETAKVSKEGQNTPIAGFLYSVSRTAAGEYWPIYEGPNKIGRGAENVVKLNDKQISENHATLVVRPMYDGDTKTGILVFVQDMMSTCGTKVNGTSLGFEAKECHNGDILTIGPNYELLLILVDAASLGLTQKEALKDVETVETGEPGGVWVTPLPGGNPKGTILQGGNGQSGNNPLSAGDATIYMPK